MKLEKLKDFKGQSLDIAGTLFNTIDLQVEQITNKLNEIISYLNKEDKVEIKKGTKYWIVTDYGEKTDYKCQNSKIDNYRLNIGNFYLNESDCDKEVERLQALARVRKYIRENELSGGDYFLYYNVNENKLTWYYAVHTYNAELENIKSQEACEQIIRENESDLKIIYRVK